MASGLTFGDGWDMGEASALKVGERRGKQGEVIILHLFQPARPLRRRLVRAPQRRSESFPDSIRFRLPPAHPLLNWLKMKDMRPQRLLLRIASVIAVFAITNTSRIQAAAPQPHSDDSNGPDIAIEFYGFRVLVDSTDKRELDAVTRESLLAMDEASRPKGYYFDGLIWGRKDKDGSVTYAGQFHDPVRESRADFEFYHRVDTEVSPMFPPSATVFGRSSEFAYRGDPRRNVIFRFRDDPPHPNFQADIDKFDVLFGLSTHPSAFFRHRWGDATRGLRIEATESTKSDGKRVVELRSIHADQGMHARLTFQANAGADELPSWWSLDQILAGGETMRWTIVLRKHSPGNRLLPTRPHDVMRVHADVQGMDDPPLARLGGGLIGNGRMTEDDLASVRSQRQLIAVGVALSVFYCFWFIHRRKEHSSC